MPGIRVTIFFFLKKYKTYLVLISALVSLYYREQDDPTLKFNNSHFVLASVSI